MAWSTSIRLIGLLGCKIEFGRAGVEVQLQVACGFRAQGNEVENGIDGKHFAMPILSMQHRGWPEFGASACKCKRHSHLRSNATS